MTGGQGYTLFLALATVGATLVTAYVAWRKWKPETVNIHVTSADTLVGIATRTAEREAAEAEALQAKVTELSERLVECEHAQRDLITAMETISRLERDVTTLKRLAEAADERATKVEERAERAEKRADVAERRAAEIEDRARRAEHRADVAERLAQHAEMRAQQAEARAIRTEERADRDETRADKADDRATAIEERADRAENGDT